MLSLLLTGTFASNHSLSKINFNLAKCFKENDAIDLYLNAIDKKYISGLDFDKKCHTPDIELRHYYPPTFEKSIAKKLVYILPWEFSRVPFEWIYYINNVFDLLVVPSQYCKTIYIQNGVDENKIVVIPNGVNAELFYNKNNRNPDIKTYLFVGSHIFRKGIDILLKVWKQTMLDKQCKLIIKDTPVVYGHNNLKEIIKTNNLHNVEIISDDVTDEIMMQLYNTCHFIVSPTRGEAFNLPVAEAMVCGVYPLVSSPSATDDYIKDSQHYIKTYRKVYDLNSIGASKSGDGFANSSHHSYVHEPIEKSLTERLLWSYYNNCLQTPSTLLIKSWKQVCFTYVIMFYKLCRTTN